MVQSKLLMRILCWLALASLTWAVGMGQPAAPQAPRETGAPKPQAESPTRTLTLEFPEEGERWWWTEDAQGKPLNAPQKTVDKQPTLQLPEKSATLWVLDAKTGNLARIDLAEQKEPKLSFTSERWSHVARVQVNVRKETAPVASALITLTDAQGKTHTQVLEPTAEGIVLFERVPLGKVSVRVQYGTDQSTTQEMTLKREREQTVPVLDMTLTGEVATLPEPAKGEATQQESAPPSSLIGTLIMAVIAGALAIAVIVLLVKLAKQKEQPLTEMMQKLGVELPANTASATASASATTPSAPPQPDLPPLETAGVPPTTTVAPVATGTPTRIVGTQGAYVGVSFSIEADLITVGREVGNGIVLDQDSTVSRRHAQFLKQGDTVFVEDLGSTNGTFVNGVRISAPTPVRPGDTVQFGACAFKVE